MVESTVQSPAEKFVGSIERERSCAKLIRVLHVDDEPGLSKVVKQCLELQDSFHVDTADSVEEALNKLKEKEYDVVVSDYQMPGKDGLQFLKELREKGSSIPFVVLTGKGREEVAVKALNLGADGYINKQGSPETVYGELAHSVKSVVARRKAEEALRSSEEKYRAYVENSPVAFFVINSEGKYEQVNNAACKLLGYSEEELLEMTTADVAFEENTPLALKHVSELKETGRSRVEFRLKRKDSKTVHVILNTAKLPDGKRIGFCEDITERKRAEEMLRKERQELDCIFNSSPIIIFYMDKQGKLLRVNKAFAEAHRRSQEDFIGKTVFDFYSAEIAQSMTNDNLEVLESRCSKLGIIEKYESASGLKWVQTDKVPIFDEYGFPNGVIGFAQDITESKRTEAELRRLATIVTDSNDAVTVVDKEGRITAWNKGAEYIYGYGKDEALGMDILKIVPEDKKQETLDLIRKIKMNETVGSFETKRLTKDGRVLDVWLTITKLVDDKGNAVALATTERDITERKRLEERLRFSEKFTVLGQLASTVAHEIRNPLGVIKNSIYFLNDVLKEHADEKVVKHLKIMERNVNSADRIIIDLLDVGRNKVGVLEPVDLNEILKRALANTSVPKNIKVITELDKIPKMLLDSEHIHRVFVNIIQNAVAAMPEGGKLIVEVSRSSDSVEISFKDSGVGIPEENMQKLFTPLFTTKAKGLGLGLTICKQIVESHKGEIEIKSKAGEGTLLIVRLPILSEAGLVNIGLARAADVLIGGMND